MVSIPVPVFAFCRQISGAEFEEQKQTSSRKAMEDLLEILLTDQNISEKDRRKKLKQVKGKPPRNVDTDTERSSFNSLEPEFYFLLVPEAVPRHLQSAVPRLRPREQDRQQAKD